MSYCCDVQKHALRQLKEKALSIVILGASGDLAGKKTFPALFALYCFGLLPEHAHLVGYARSALTAEELESKIKKNCLKVVEDEEKLQAFFQRLSYVAGKYDSAEDFAHLNTHLDELEHQEDNPSGNANRLIYFAIPPPVFVPAATAMQNCMSKTGWTRVVVEKPFGHDLASCRELIAGLGAVLKETQQFRIDHYLGKEMVQNLFVMRFANKIFQPLWTREHIRCVIITFKEPFGTEGRGGYFDTFGIIRDVMQNHLIQVLSLVAMERPISTRPEDVRDEKVKVLRCIPPLTLENLVVGQYVGDGKNPGYKEDPGVPADSTCPTYATAVLYIHNERWENVPFILKCGKALNERKADIRVQFNDVPGALFADTPRNELVIRIQPREATYLKMQAKVPGLSDDRHQTELNLTYENRYSDIRLPDAYERLIFDVLKGDHSQFVRADELEAAWKIFTPVLHQLESEKIPPIPYTFGSRGPKESDELVAHHGYVRDLSYSWSEKDSANL